MKILVVNKFLFPKGGDAITALNTGELLVSHGHQVMFWGMQHPLAPAYPHSNYFVPYIDFNNLGSLVNQAKMAFNIVYSISAKKMISKLLIKEKPDIVHLHNFAHQISPSILDVLKKNRIPIVMTMHDYKLVCPTYNMLLNDLPCERCKNRQFYQCFINKCSKNSYSKSMVNTIEMYLHHKIMHIYDAIDIFISPSQFLKNELHQMGFKREISVLPNFVCLDDYQPQYHMQEKTIIYFGRLSKEKGLLTLINAMTKLDIKLKIIGDGPLKETLVLEVKNHGLKNIEFAGYKTGGELREDVRRSLFTVLPSQWFENYPRSVIESFALGKTVIGSSIGGIPELIKDGETGLTFKPGNAEDLCSKIKYLFNNPDRIITMGKNARAFVEKELNGEKHYEGLLTAYRQALASQGKNKQG